MKITPFDWTVDLEDIATLRCPVCKTPWITDQYGDYIRKECEHLRFVWSDGGLEYFGEWDIDAFEQSYGKVFMETEDVDDLEDVNMVNVDYDVLGSFDFPEIDERFTITESGLACGSVSITTFFGIRH